MNLSRTEHYDNEKSYLNLLDRVVVDGHDNVDRTLEGTRRVFGESLKFNLSYGTMPVITTKEINLIAVQNETDWFLSGSTNTHDLNRLGTRIWDQWAPVSHRYDYDNNSHPTSFRQVARIDRSENITRANKFKSLKELIREYNDVVSYIVETAHEIISSDAISMCIKYTKHTYYHYAKLNGWVNELDAYDVVDIPELTEKGCYGLSVNLIGNSMFFNKIHKESPDKFPVILPYYGGQWIDEDDYIYFDDEIPDIFNYTEGDVFYKKHRVSTLQGVHGGVVYTHDASISSSDIKDIYRRISPTRTVSVSSTDIRTNTHVLRPVLTTGELGPIYGAQWRNISGKDQLKELIEGLKTNPNSRRHLVTAWNPTMIEDMELPPCHIMMQFFCEDLNENELNTAEEWWSKHVVDPTRPNHVPTKRLSLQFYMRSSDLAIGLPFNLINYSLILCKVATTCGFVVGDITYCAGDAHIYLNHLEGVAEQVKRIPYPSPTYLIVANPHWLESNHPLSEAIPSVEIYDYYRHPAIKLPVAV